MIRTVCGMLVAIVVLVDAANGWSHQQYLYTPTAVGGEGAVQSRDGILVQEVPVQKGDSLFKISRRFSGHGSYYSQILLFNEIRNPNRIYPGSVFKIPVPRNRVAGQVTAAPRQGEKPVASAAAAAVQEQGPVSPVASAVTDIPVQDLKKGAAGGEKKRGSKVKASKQASGEKQAAAAGAAGGQKLFENAVKAYRQDDCTTALALFDRFLAENQVSPLAADASLYKAECYLKLSTQK